jgi:alkylhydroperoxidase family enzyme
LEKSLMARIQPVDPARAPDGSREELERQLVAHGRITNMKRTLAHSPAALAALMTWYPLRDKVAAFLGDRATTLFAHAVSAQADCLICSTFFRRLLFEAGENPDQLQLNSRDLAVVDYGRQLARDANGVTDELYGRLCAFLSSEQVVTLTAFAGIMIATNVFNNALRVDLDEYLWPYKKAANSQHEQATN